MAYYDPVKDKIVGAEKGTLKWYHEKMHQVIAKDEVINHLKILAEYAIVLSVFCIFFNLWLIGFLAISYVVALIVGEELICWYWAYMNHTLYKEKKVVKKKRSKKHGKK